MNEDAQGNEIEQDAGDSKEQEEDTYQENNMTKHQPPSWFVVKADV